MGKNDGSGIDRRSFLGVAGAAVASAALLWKEAGATDANEVTQWNPTPEPEEVEMLYRYKGKVYGNAIRNIKEVKDPSQTLKTILNGMRVTMYQTGAITPRQFFGPEARLDMMANEGRP